MTKYPNQMLAGTATDGVWRSAILDSPAARIDTSHVRRPRLGDVYERDTVEPDVYERRQAMGFHYGTDRLRRIRLALQRDGGEGVIYSTWHELTVRAGIARGTWRLLPVSEQFVVMP